MSNLSQHTRPRRSVPFKLDPAASAIHSADKSWRQESVLERSVFSKDYADTDWTDVPKIDFLKGEHTNRSVPEAAEIVEEEQAQDFLLDDEVVIKHRNSRGLNTAIDSAIDESNSVTLEVERANYFVKPKENPTAQGSQGGKKQTQASVPFIATYGESRKALLQKLGFKEDFMLSMGAFEAAIQSSPSERADEREEEDGTSLETPASKDLSDSTRSLTAQQEGDDAEIGKHSKQSGLNAAQEGDPSSGKSLAAATDLGDVDEGESRSESEGDDKPSSHHLKNDETLTDEALLEQKETVKSGSKTDSGTQQAFDEGYEKGFQAGLLEARDKSAAQESLQAEEAQKLKEVWSEREAAREKELSEQREKERKEYESEIQSLKDKIKSLDESLLGELEQKKAQLEEDMKPQVQLLTEVANQLKALIEDQQSFFEPLKRLSVHIAEQLVLGELSMSPVVIQRLIQRCLDELDMRGNPLVNVELNPLDKKVLESSALKDLAPLNIQASSTLQVGSVRVQVNDAQIEDLIQNRLESIASRLLGQPQRWRDESSLLGQAVKDRYLSNEDFKEELKEEVKEEVKEAVLDENNSKTIGENIAEENGAKPSHLEPVTGPKASLDLADPQALDGSTLSAETREGEQLLDELDSKSLGSNVPHVNESSSDELSSNVTSPDEETPVVNGPSPAREHKDA